MSRKPIEVGARVRLAIAVDEAMKIVYVHEDDRCVDVAKSVGIVVSPIDVYGYYTVRFPFRRYSGQYEWSLKRDQIEVIDD
jgi:hypothetical protein